MPVLRSELLPSNINCPHCASNMDLDEQERIEKRFTCPACNRPIDLRLPVQAMQPQAEAPSSDNNRVESKRTTAKWKNEDWVCGKCDGSIRSGDQTCSWCGEKLEWDKPRHAPPTPQERSEPGRGVPLFLLGFLSIAAYPFGFRDNWVLILGPLLGIPAWIMGTRDLKKIRMGLIAVTQKGLTKSGMILGIIGTFLCPVVLVVLAIGVAIPTGVGVYSEAAIASNRDALTNDLVNLASRAGQYYRRPAAYGGGGTSFNGLSSIAKLTNKPKNDNGTYWIVGNAGGDGPIEIGGKGVAIFKGKPVEVHILVYPTEDRVVVVN